ncbi:glycoside hydrolase family 99-like domain-containing protein [Chitinophaga sp.]|uniref:glycoside hydrolase family 99-like domain-containing protein n=1 Tax=Chitinophaga sp. TaxID=1869181 RepID=UPI002C3DF578|nr:glycoside hydrolase family 99-like domain-containing protein [Chitinophaga sp.]HWV64217.1 glycoside hydrolase family 99-like domain-containing protein [Chitinophaga sp.]
MRTTLYIFCCLLILASCKKDKEYLPPDFNYPIPPVDITENVNVGAYFYNYAAADWNKGITDTPLLGNYSALAASVMNQERIWADSAGVDFFIFNWNGASGGDPVLNSFVAGRSSNVKMVINFNTAHINASNTSPVTGAKLNTLIKEFKSLSSSHFANDYYYKINGQPVVMITPLNLSSSKAASIDYPSVIAALRASLDSIGVHPYIIGEITTGWLPPGRYSTAINAMDAVVLSDWSTSTYDRSVFMPAYTDQNWKNWTDSTTTWKKDFVPAVFPGFNDKVMTPSSALFNQDRSGEFYTDMANVAKRNMSSKRLVLINSWNDFQKGTGLEPTGSYGRTYMGITRKQFKVN